MKFVIDVPDNYVEDNPGGKFLRIPYFLTAVDWAYFETNVCLEPYYEEPEKNAKNDIIEALEILRDNMIEVGDTFTGMIESMRREHEG